MLIADINVLQATNRGDMVTDNELACRKLVSKYKCLANAKRPCDCLRPRSSLCSCAISDMTSFGCRDQGRDSVCPVLKMST